MRFKFYILISLLIHSIILIFAPVNIKKERLKGEKITPIEIINNESFNSSKGNTNKNSAKKVPKKIQDKKDEIIKKVKKIQETKNIKLKDTNDKLTGDFPVKKKEIIEKFEKKFDKKILRKEKQIKNNNKALIKEKKLENSKISNPQKRGVSDKQDNKEIEKGSVKGKGNLKITCLNCISPKYPRKALKKGLEGKPTVKVFILKSGYVEKAEITISSGVSSIDNAALEAAKNSRFYPLPLDSFLNIQYDLKLR
tara:strand:+ start:85 stop:843 length:759 start_codon:yes stop_codon:yes gene_type:complete